MSSKHCISLKIFGFLLFGIFTSAQNILNDPSIVAHHKRMVYESWGDWRPYPKYVLGVQTNFAYATVWGWLSPSINQNYKNGPDIRPLKPTGTEVQRLAQVKFQEQQSVKISQEIDSLHKRNVQDFAHWTSATVDADPLWLLYYNKMLKPLRDFPEKPQNYIQWNLRNQQVYETLNSTGTINRLQEELDILKDKYRISRTADMPRGKRFIMYHETLMGWRRFFSELRHYSEKTTILLKYKNIMAQNYLFSSGEWQLNLDQQIATRVMLEYKNKF